MDRGLWQHGERKRENQKTSTNQSKPNAKLGKVRDTQVRVMMPRPLREWTGAWQHWEQQLPPSLPPREGSKDLTVNTGDPQGLTCSNRKCKHVPCQRLHVWEERCVCASLPPAYREHSRTQRRNPLISPSRRSPYPPPSSMGSTDNISFRSSSHLCNVVISKLPRIFPNWFLDFSL